MTQYTLYTSAASGTVCFQQMALAITFIIVVAEIAL